MNNVITTPILNILQLLIDSFGEKGKGFGLFDRPVGIDMDVNTGDLFITDHNNGVIQVFNKECQFKYQMSSKGMLSGELSCPRGISLYNNLEKQNIYVTDNHRLQIFNGDCEKGVVYSFGCKEKGNSMENFAFPEGIAIDKKTNMVYVADWENKRIQIFKTI